MHSCDYLVAPDQQWVRIPALGISVESLLDDFYQVDLQLTENQSDTALVRL